MVFSSPVFLFYFLPVVFLLYFLGRRLFPKHFLIPNFILLLASLLFYLYGSGAYVAVLLFVIAVTYLFGACVAKRHPLGFYLGILLPILVLIIFKYSNFITGELSSLASSFGFANWPVTDIVLPLGISFFTFQGVSYVIDVHRAGHCNRESFLDVSLFISMFPQLVAGPIVRYDEIREQLNNHPSRLEDISTGGTRFIWGLAKKVLVADSCAVVADQVFTLAGYNLTTATTLVGMIAYSLQIYFDFSGYSDMAIGLGRIFGFRFPENFRRPYSAISMTDFWRRWHMTLTRWFRDYVYIPLGGNRNGTLRTYRNLWIVFLCTGLWHGANWTFIIWGLFHGMCLCLEKLFNVRMPQQYFGLRRILVFLLVSLGWIIFRSDNLDHMLALFGSLLSQPNWTLPIEVSIYLTNKNLFIMALGLGTLLMPGDLVMGKVLEKERLPIYQAARISVCVILSGLILLQISSSKFSPFIYFQF